MIQEEKELALRDLCARLPYGINCEYQGKVHGIVGFNHGKVTIYEHFQSEPKFPFVEEVKLYLFPLSSINEEQSKELFKLFGISLADSDYIKINECTGITFFLDKGFDVETHLDKLIDWLNKNHFDWRGLIEKGLAIDATGLNIY